MKDVWVVKVKLNNMEVAEVIFSSERRAESYADAYRETTEHKYDVSVVRREVL